ncbi:hypothetical protein Q0812_13040 [Brevundimonas sp. 2R-24]|uniref:Uncharacterized protein n=1 Tax=Peiella sedimenti TaxID=3061083 RepID=A0ABT8SP58_9CAUL|nr:hypothetical protein [Caulobacteraceae bacterium XZ-24]
MDGEGQRLAPAEGAAILAYVADMARQLAEMARQEGETHLSELLSLASDYAGRDRSFDS